MKQLTDGQFRQVVLDAAERLQRKLIRYSSRFFGGDENSARDIVQHAFLQLCQISADSRPEKLDAWLYRVCRNRAIDTQRSNSRLFSADPISIDQQTDPQCGVNDRLAEQELWSIIRRRISLLPPTQREAIELWSDGFRYAEIAQIMDKVESSVRVMVHRAITKLRHDPTIRLWLDEDHRNQKQPDKQPKISTHC